FYYDKLVELTNGTKYIAMMENGSIPDPDTMVQYGANWGLFITWNGDFLMDGKHNSKDFLNKVYNDPRVITLEDLPFKQQ
ncbi:MAG TPA: glycoside hydrolase family 26 protein, partial [Candidatus Paenibacillus intestinavium]|nr:glycoside hydrolase family 26 protein [Candidatus Paenibacillus intestinavium]